ncbi:YlbG family protein [Furfurilactobacillus curtus]|uniref:DUF2129 domain-containing protein n=1 Tax=Furfurilactobacillus curtus TaxID=1746200 RepID=A0ABQ5JPG4_9LACO
MSETDSHTNKGQSSNRGTHGSSMGDNNSDQERPKRRPRRRRRRPQGQQTAAATDSKQATGNSTTKKAQTTDRAKKPRRRRSNRRKPTEDSNKSKQVAAKSQTALSIKKGTETVTPSQQTTPNVSSSHADINAGAKIASQIRDDLALAFVGHDPQPLQPVARQAVFVFIRNLRQVRQLKRFGDIDYVSKKMHYVVIYMDQARIESQRQALNKLNFVKRVVVSERPTVDPFVGQGVNANFVTHTKGDGGADALSVTDSGEA